MTLGGDTTPSDPRALRLTSDSAGIPRVFRPMVPATPTDWDRAIWVGALDVDDLNGPHDEIALEDSAEYRTARVLLRSAEHVLGFVEVPVVDGRARVADLRERLDALPPRIDVAPKAGTASISVVICTRDRPELLRQSLQAVLRTIKDGDEIVVVDNASATTATRDLVVNEFGGLVTLTSEPIPGLARARNTGVAAARCDVIAFTDDDTVVDVYWLDRIRAEFADPDVACVSGLVPSGEVETPTQAYFDDRVMWSRNVAARRFSMAEPPADLPMFPFCVGEFGTGANFAVRASVIAQLEGFDIAFGVGTRTSGGEDLDFFTRVLLGNGVLVVQPDVLVWHRHRRDLQGLRKQTIGYGRGLGAWLTKLALHPRTLRLAAVRSPQAMSRLLAKRRATPSVEVNGGPKPFVLSAKDDFSKEVDGLARLELRSVFGGPLAYLLERRAGRRPAPGR